MTDMIIRSARVWKLDGRLHQPFKIALGQHDTVENVLFMLELAGGTRGYGEAAVAPHITGETRDKTLENLKKAAAFLEGKNAAGYLSLAAESAEMLDKNRCALAAAEMALLDAVTRSLNIPLWKFFGPRPSLLKTDMTVVLGTADEAEAAAIDIRRRGIRALKVKIGKDVDSDFERVLRVRRVCPRDSIYLDANQGYSAPQALKFLKKLKKAGIKPEVFEQPVHKHDWDGLRYITKRTDVPVCADETVYSLPDAIKAVNGGYVSAVNIKLMKSGIFAGRETADICRAKGVRLMIGAMMESRLSSNCAAHFASGLGCFDFVDLDTPFFIKNDFMKGGGLKPDGTYDLRSIEAGIGVVPVNLPSSALRIRHSAI